MENILQNRLEGSRKALQRIYAEIAKRRMTEENLSAYLELIATEMGTVGFDTVDEDSLGTLYGTIRGVEPGEDFLLVTHADFDPPPDTESDKERMAGMSDLHKSGLLSALYAAGALKAALLPLKGDLIVCCVPRARFGLFAIENFYNEVILPRNRRIKGVLLSEPTGCKLCLGHKGRLEYEIIVRGRVGSAVAAMGGVNMLGAMFPLVHELEKVSAGLPSDSALGHSSLRIRDIRYNDSPDIPGGQEFRVCVDRVFVPEESPVAILERARSIAASVYRGAGDLAVSAGLVNNRMQTRGSAEETVSEFMPWIMAGHNPFVLASRDALKEHGFQTDFDYWKSTFTEGSFTCGKLGLPTAGFGPGAEGRRFADIKPRDIERAALGQALIIHRNIGIPTFGWSEDEI
ncbi:MAG: hypothetical protein V1913_09060 [Fibrobacterota bacterium]